MKRLSLRVVEGLARRRHGNRLKRDFNAQVPIPARTGNGFGEDEKSVRPPLLVTMGRGFLLPGQMARARCSAPLKKSSGRAAAHPGEAIVMEKNAGFMKALKCRECGREYPLAATHVCEFDFGPLEVVYDYDRI